MRTWILFDAEDSWASRRQKIERLAGLPGPLYLASGPGLNLLQEVVLVSDTPWTPEAIRNVLHTVYSDEEPDEVALWLARW